jgi:Flp pilus assembly pilin Flp
MPVARAFRTTRMILAAAAAKRLSQALVLSRRGSTMVQYCVLAFGVSLAIYGTVGSIGASKSVRLTDISNAFTTTR